MKMKTEFETRFGQWLAGGGSEGRRRDDFRNGAGPQRRRQPLTEADAAEFPGFRAGRAGGK